MHVSRVHESFGIATVCGAFLSLCTVSFRPFQFLAAESPRVRGGVVRGGARGIRRDETTVVPSGKSTPEGKKKIPHYFFADERVEA